MIPRTPALDLIGRGRRYSEEIMLKEESYAKCRVKISHFALPGDGRKCYDDVR